MLASCQRTNGAMLFWREGLDKNQFFGVSVRPSEKMFNIQ